MGISNWRRVAEFCALEWEDDPKYQKDDLVCQLRKYSHLWVWVLVNKIDSKQWKLISVEGLVGHPSSSALETRISAGNLELTKQF